MKWQHPAVGHWYLIDGSYRADLKLREETWQTLVTFDGVSIFYTLYVDRQDAMHNCIASIHYDRHVRDPNRSCENEDDE